MNENRNDSLGGKVSEMTGLADLGLHKDALVLARQILSAERLDATAFNDALSAILIGGEGLESWKELIRAAYNHLPEQDQPEVGPEMLGYYHFIGDLKSAMDFASAPARTGDLLLAMEVW